MKFKLLIFLLIGISSICSSQKNFIDVVYLKNGSIIHGTIIEQIMNVSIKIETADKNVFVYKYDEIEKINKEEQLQNTYNAINRPGYQGNTEFLISFIGDGESFIKINSINGYRFNPYFSIAIGTGVWFDYEFKDAIIPLFLDLRCNILNSRITPYVAIGAGKAWVATEEFESDGYFANLSMGVAFHLTRKGKYRGAYNLGIDFSRQE